MTENVTIQKEKILDRINLAYEMREIIFLSECDRWLD